MVSYAKRNAELSGLSSAPIRYIVDDCVKFCEREKRRGNRYDGIIMDPPSYGRGPGGEKWTLEDSVDGLVGLASELMTAEPLFFILNSYTTGLSAATTGYVLMKNLPSFGSIESHELGLPVRSTGGILPCGATSRWKA
ncbi:MAG: SAM-dependent methyltransferase, partial [Clostridia bacterium]|nr:SAM-dependent methyltransferase [Clostridia bacterium]